MKLLLVNFLFLLLVCSGCSRSNKSKVNCTKWHTGKFEIVDAKRNILIERDENVQTETDRNTGNYSKFRVDWLDNCSYQLRFLEGEEGMFQVWQENYLDVTIIASTDKGYRYRAKFSTSDVIEENEITQID